MLPTNTTLDDRQQVEYNKIVSNDLLKNPHFISIEELESYNGNGEIRLFLPFLPVTDILYTAVNVEFKDNSNFYWYGRNNSLDDDVNHSTFSLTRTGNVYSGNITFEEHSFEIHDLSGGILCISELKLENMAIHDCSSLRDEPIVEKTTRGPCAAQDTKILVIYNDDALSVDGNIHALAQEGVNQMNSIWIQSDIPNNATLVATHYHNFTRTQDGNLDILNLSNSSSIQSLRNLYQADIVVLMIGQPYDDGLQGIAANIGGGYGDAYCIVNAVTAIGGTRTFAHEITHLYGGRHDDDPDPTSANAHIFRTGVPLFGKLRFTTMASMPVGKTRIDNISNPNIEFNNRKTGTPDRDNASTVTSMINTIANFKQDPSLLLDAIITWPTISSCSDHPTVTITGKCGEPPYTYQWQRSTDGINWTTTFTTNWAHIHLPQPTGLVGNVFVKYRVFVTDATNNSVMKSKTYNFNCYEVALGKPGNSEIIEEPISIIPNPNNGAFSIALNNTFSGNLKIQILDIRGKLILEKEFIDVKNYIEIHDLSNMSKGNYMMKITNSKHISKALKLSIN